VKTIQAAKHGGTQTHVTRIVIHGTVSPCVRGGAVNVARYFQTPAAGGSAHYVVDPGEVVRCLAETTVAYHAPPNTGSIGVELCDPQQGPASRWADDNHEAMLRLAAALVRDIAARWDVPLRRLTVAEVRAGARGICGHVDVSRAFGQSDHTDPGTGFPWAHFMQLVTGEDDMPSAKEIADAVYDRFTHTVPEDVWAAREGILTAGQKIDPRTAFRQIWAYTKDGYARDREILAQLGALSATVKTLADALAQRDTTIDADALIERIRQEIAQVTIHLDAGPSDPPDAS